METDKSETRRTRSISGIIAFAAFGVIVLIAFSINVLSANTNSKKTELFEVDFGTANLANSEQVSEPEKAALAKEQLSSSGENLHDYQGDVETRTSEEITSKFRNATHNGTGEETTGPVEVPGREPYREPYVDKGGLGGNFGHSLAGRKIIGFPSLENTTSDEGKVVVDVVVNSEGKVMEAVAGGRGTTTASIKLKEQAQKMAMQTVFSKDQKREEQHGTIIIVFEFN